MKRSDVGRAALLAAARRVAGEGSPSRVSLRDIAKAAGYSPAACYRYFASREHLIDALATEVADEISNAAIAAARAEPAEDRLIAAALAYLRYAIANRGLFYLVFEAGEGDFVALERRAVGMKLADLFGDLAGRPDLGACLWGAIHGMVDLLIKGLIDVGQREQGLHVLASRGDTLLRGLVEQMTAQGV